MGNDRNLYIMWPGGSTPRQVTKNTNRSDCEPAWSPDGTKIAFTDSGIWTANADGSGEATRIVDSSANNPNWSPDGSRIAFEASRQTGCCYQSDVWVVNADGSGRTNLTNTPGQPNSSSGGGGVDEEHPVWSSDGRTILYVRDTSYSDNELWRMNADGTNQRLVPNPIRNYSYTGVSPDWQARSTTAG